jgi:hypothetical protein
MGGPSCINQTCQQKALSALSILTFFGGIGAIIMSEIFKSQSVWKINSHIERGDEG